MKNVKKEFNKTKIIALGVVLLILAVYPFAITSSYWINMAILILLYSFWGSAWNLIGGFAGQLSQGHAVFVGVGAYTTILLYLYEGIPAVVGMFVGALISGVLALAMGGICFRLKGSYYTLCTVALLYIFRIVFMTQQKILGYDTFGALGIVLPWEGESYQNLLFVSKVPYYYIILLMFLACFILCKWLNESKTGYYLAAIRTNQNAANSLGVNVMGYKEYVYFLSAALTALGGGFYVMYLGVCDPSSLFNYDFAIRIMLLAVIGGRGTLWGPVLGAVVLTPLNEILRSQLGSRLSGLSFVIYGLVLMVVIMYMPSGLIGVVDKIKAHRANRKEQEVS